MMLKPVLIFVAALSLPSLALAQQAVPWGSSDKPAPRQDIEGMKAYYEPEKVESSGSVHTFTLYRTSIPSASDEMGRYMINCETREMVSVIGGKTTAPARILAGEEFYPIGKKLCNWDKKGFFKKMLD